ncbi:MAG: hypothetical protein ACRD1Y_13565 [Terriglobales bacterium]
MRALAEEQCFQYLGREQHVPMPSEDYRARSFNAIEGKLAGTRLFIFDAANRGRYYTYVALRGAVEFPVCENREKVMEFEGWTYFYQHARFLAIAGLSVARLGTVLDGLRPCDSRSGPPFRAPAFLDPRVLD